MLGECLCRVIWEVVYERPSLEPLPHCVHMRHRTEHSTAVWQMDRRTLRQQSEAFKRMATPTLMLPCLYALCIQLCSQIIQCCWALFSPIPLESKVAYSYFLCPSSPGWLSLGLSPLASVGLHIFTPGLVQLQIQNTTKCHKPLFSCTATMHKGLTGPPQIKFSVNGM